MNSAKLNLVHPKMYSISKLTLEHLSLCCRKTLASIMVLKTTQRSLQAALTQTVLKTCSQKLLYSNKVYVHGTLTVVIDDQENILVDVKDTVFKEPETKPQKRKRGRSPRKHVPALQEKPESPDVSDHDNFDIADNDSMYSGDTVDHTLNIKQEEDEEMYDEDNVTVKTEIEDESYPEYSFSVDDGVRQLQQLATQLASDTSSSGQSHQPATVS